MQFRMLGTLEVLDGGRPVPLGRPKQRVVLAILLVHANRVVALDRLVEELWGEDPPAQAIGSLQAYVSHLRRLLEPGRSSPSLDRPATGPPRRCSASGCGPTATTLWSCPSSSGPLGCRP
jgi:DNA-binding SARP family transcriptional activator